MGRYQGTSGAAYEGTDGADVQRVAAPRVPGLGRGYIKSIKKRNALNGDENKRTFVLGERAWREEECIK